METITIICFVILSLYLIKYISDLEYRIRSCEIYIEDLERRVYDIENPNAECLSE
jgi:hypothetical protein